MTMTAMTIFANHGRDSFGGLMFWSLFLTFPTLVLVPCVLGVVSFALRRRRGLRHTGAMILVAVVVIIVVPPVVVALGPEPEFGEGLNQAILPNFLACSLSVIVYAMGVAHLNRTDGRASPPS